MEVASFSLIAFLNAFFKGIDEMGMKTTILAATVAAFCSGSMAQAAMVTYQLPFIGTWDGYTTNDTSLTFSGDGYVGMYDAVQNDEDKFAALFGLEQTNYSRTNIQVGIGGLAGQTITSAVLSFVLRDGGGSQDVLVTGYEGDGALGYQWNTPALKYGDVTYTASSGDNAFDVTALLGAAVADGADWFNLHLQGLLDGTYLWTYAGDLYPVDNALLRLTVTYDDGDPGTEVPLPASVTLLLAGMGGLAWVRRRRG